MIKVKYYSYKTGKLIRESIDKLDYVIVHELSHFVCFDHSSSFWALVEKYCPNYKKIMLYVFIFNKI